MKPQKVIVLLTALSILTFGGPTLGQTPEELIAVRGAAHAALNNHDVPLFLTYFTDEAILDFSPAPVPFVGHDAIGAFLASELAAFPDWQATDRGVLATENVVVAPQVLTGTQEGIWNGIPPTGNPIQIPMLAFVDFEGDKIKRLTAYADAAGEMVQLGAAPVPAAPALAPSVAVPDAEATGLSPMEANEELLSRWNSHDLVEFFKMVHPDTTFFDSGFGILLDRDAYLAGNEMLLQAFPDLIGQFVRSIDLGDGWVAVEVIFTGTHTGPFMGMPPTGLSVTLRAGSLRRFDAAGLLTDFSLYYDNMSLMAQIMPKAPEWPAAPDYLIQDEVYSPSLEGNLLGDPATRPVLVYLPPSYETSPERRYPTVYLLHGFLANEKCFTSSGIAYALGALTGMNVGGDVGTVAGELMAAGQMDELIIVMPNAANSFGGSMYERSPLLGDYRDYIAKDLVAYIDGKYRTIAESHARGIAGHSMGGYGALSLALEYPDVFGAVAALSPAFSDMETDTLFNDVMAQYPLVPGLPVPGYAPDDMWNVFLGYFDINVLYGLAAAWTPNLENPPFYVDLPIQYPGPTMATDIWDIWKERDLVSQIEHDGANLSGKPIFIDEGKGPAMLMAEVTGVDSLLAALHAQGLSCTYDTFDGDHLTHFHYQLASALSFLSPHIASAE